MKGFYPKNVLNVLGILADYRNFKRPRKKGKLPIFTEDEIRLLAIYLFFKPEDLKLMKILK